MYYSNGTMQLEVLMVTLHKTSYLLIFIQRECLPACPHPTSPHPLSGGISPMVQLYSYTFNALTFKI